jgi:hypothetical protein
MNDTASDIDLAARLAAATAYRPGPAEMNEIAILVETAARPVGIGGVTGIEPATQYVPIADISPA